MDNQQNEKQEIITTEQVSNEETVTNEGGLSDNVAGLLAYLFGFITGIIFLIVGKDREFVRFHAWQSILISITFSVIWGVIVVFDLILAYIPLIGWLLGLMMTGTFGLFTFGVWIFFMVRAYQGARASFPIIGGIASGLAGK